MLSSWCEPVSAIGDPLPRAERCGGGKSAQFVWVLRFWRSEDCGYLTAPPDSVRLAAGRVDFLRLNLPKPARKKARLRAVTLPVNLLPARLLPYVMLCRGPSTQRVLVDDWSLRGTVPGRIRTYCPPPRPPPRGRALAVSRRTALAKGNIPRRPADPFPQRNAAPLPRRNGAYS